MSTRSLATPGIKGKAWGNALGGYKTQRRDLSGKFARKSAAPKSYQNRVANARKYRSPRVKTKVAGGPSPQTKIKGAGRSFKINGATKGKVALGGGTVAVGLGIIAAGSAINPQFSISRKSLSLGLRPNLNLGNNFKLSSSHLVTLDRTSDDFYDRRKKQAAKKASAQFGKVTSNKGARQVFDSAVGLRDNATVGGVRFENGGPAQPRRWRYTPGSNQSPPGAPAVAKGKTKPKPKSPGKKASASTINNQVKSTGPTYTGVKRKRKSQKFKGAQAKRKRTQPRTR